MSTPLLLLAPDTVELYASAAGQDERGWALPPAAGTLPAWSGSGNLQLSAGVSDPRAAEGGGHGPHSPARVEEGTLYLPFDASPADGMAAVVRGVRWVLSQCRLIADPSGGALTCWAATATRDQVVADG